MADQSAPDAERGRALVHRLFEHPRQHAESAEWEQALADLRVWSMAAWEPANETDRLREALRIALDAMRRSADDHNCDYCRADIAATERAMGEAAFDEDNRS